MTTPILRNAIGSALTVTTANAIANNAYANSADQLRIQNTGNALLADFRLTGATFATAPVGGAVQIAIVDRDLAGNAGPTPSSSMVPNRIYTLGPMPSTGNASTGWVMGVDAVPMTADQDVWLYNNGTAYSLNSGCTLSAQLWSPGA